MKIKPTGDLDCVAIKIDIELPDERDPDMWEGFGES